MLFVTGTDTGVGKTFVSSLLIRQLRQAKIAVAGFKPICCGDREDAIRLVQASEESLSVNECNPIWMRFPASPYTASIIEERLIDLNQIREQWTALKSRFECLVVEGIGGWHVPIQRDYSTADLARELGLPVLIVAKNRLGVINHTLLTVEAVRASGLKCVGIILNSFELPNDPIHQTNYSVLQDILANEGVVMLGEVSGNQQSLPETVIGNIFSQKLLAPPTNVGH